MSTIRIVSSLTGSVFRYIEKLTKKFGKFTAVDNIDLDASTPQMIGITGPSGAGKSTFLRMINRLTPATNGKIVVDGRCLNYQIMSS